MEGRLLAYSFQSYVKPACQNKEPNLLCVSVHDKKYGYLSEIIPINYCQRKWALEAVGEKIENR